MACIVCGGYIAKKKASNNSSGMFCGHNCALEWGNLCHFVKVTWKLPKWVHHGSLRGGTSLQALKTYFIK